MQGDSIFKTQDIEGGNKNTEHSTDSTKPDRAQLSAVEGTVGSASFEVWGVERMRRRRPGGLEVKCWNIPRL